MVNENRLHNLVSSSSSSVSLETSIPEFASSVCCDGSPCLDVAYVTSVLFACVVLELIKILNDTFN